MKYRKTLVKLTDWLMLAALAVCIISGIMLHSLHGAIGVLIIHKISAVVFVIGMIAHMVQHKK
ncbi:MAG: hypothetical protein ACI4E1_04035 [Lachnospira sp.]